MKIIAIMNNKGGVLKTSLTANLAYVAAKKGKRVLLIDTDTQGSLSLRFGKDPIDIKKDLFDIFKGDKITSSMYQVEHKGSPMDLHIIPSTFNLLENQFSTGATTKTKVQNAFKRIRAFAKENEFDLIIVDTAPTFTSISSFVVEFVDQIIVPAKMEKDSYAGFFNLYKLLEEDNMENKITHIIPSIVNIRTNLHRNVLNDIFIPLEEKIGIKITKNIINDSIKAAEYNGTHNFVISAFKKNIKAKRVYFNLAKELELW